MLGDRRVVAPKLEILLLAARLEQPDLDARQRVLGGGDLLEPRLQAGLGQAGGVVGRPDGD